jgi:hypothetical protein
MLMWNGNVEIAKRLAVQIMNLEKIHGPSEFSFGDEKQPETSRQVSPHAQRAAWISPAHQTVKIHIPHLFAFI